MDACIIALVGETGNLEEQQLRLPFDQYQRYRMVTDVVERLRDGNGSLRVLDVGGAEGTILNFLDGDEVTILDQMPVEGAPGFVQGDATALPFDDASFDYAVSVDTFEHIAPDARERHLSELRRVARRGVLLAGPFAGGGVREAEELAHELFRALYGQEHKWLEEHEEHGLPELGHARKFYEELGDSVTVLPNGYLPNWLAMICLFFYGVQPRRGLTRTAERANRFYNRFLYEHDNTEPCYRYVVAALREPAVGLEDLASPPADRQRADLGLAFLGSLVPTLPLSAELHKLTARLEAKDNQLALKELRIRDLSGRLANQVAHAHGQRALRQENQGLRSQLDAMTASRAWRIARLVGKLRRFGR